MSPRHFGKRPDDRDLDLSRLLDDIPRPERVDPQPRPKVYDQGALGSSVACSMALEFGSEPIVITREDRDNLVAQRRIVVAEGTIEINGAELSGVQMLRLDRGDVVGYYGHAFKLDQALY